MTRGKVAAEGVVVEVAVVVELRPVSLLTRHLQQTDRQ